MSATQESRRPSPPRLRQRDLRLIIAIPALIVLLIIGLGLGNYLSVLGAAQRLVQGQAADNVVPRLMREVITLLLAFSLLALLTGLGLVWTILRPIRKMAAAAADIAGGRFDQPVRLSGGFEIDELGKSFNSLIASLQATIDERDAFLRESLTAGSMVVDLDGRILSINDPGREILAADARDLAGKTLSEAAAGASPAAKRLLEFCRQALGKDPSAPSGAETKLEPGDERGKPLTVGSSFLKDAGGAPIFAVFHFRDLSRVRNLSLLFSRTDQLAALGTFTMGLSHELRNPLAAIKGVAQLLQEKMGGRGPGAPHLERIVREVNRLDSLVRELYDFSRSPAGERTPRDAGRLAREALAQALSGLTEDDKARKTLLEEYAEGLPAILVQPDRMLRAIGNVVINAFEQMPPGARLLVKTSLEREHASESVVIEITNSGSSLPKENPEKVFEPFYSTRSGGTGLGLAIAYQIAAQNGCLLSARQDGEFVRFRFAFRPAAPPSPRPRAGNPGAPS